MKVCIALLAVILVCGNGAVAQVSAPRFDANAFKPRPGELNRAPQAVYAGIGGPGLVLSVNYDRRFAKRAGGLGFAVGVGGFYFPDELALISVPVSVNYLFGKRSHFFELAGGASFVAIGAGLEDWDTDAGAGIIGHASAGYRYQRSPRGFFFRGGISPLMGGGEVMPFFYLGFGTSF